MPDEIDAYLAERNLDRAIRDIDWSDLSGSVTTSTAVNTRSCPTLAELSEAVARMRALARPVPDLDHCCGCRADLPPVGAALYYASQPGAFLGSLIGYLCPHCRAAIIRWFGPAEPGRPDFELAGRPVRLVQVKRP